MSHFSSAEANGNLYLVAVAEEFNGVSQLCVKIVGINVKGKPYFLDLDYFLIFLCFFFTLCLFKTIFAVIHNAANMGSGSGRNLYKIKIFFGGNGKSVLYGNYAELRAVGIDYANFFFANLLIDKQFLFCYGLTPPNNKKSADTKKAPHRVLPAAKIKNPPLPELCLPHRILLWDGENGSFCFFVQNII